MSTPNAARSAFFAMQTSQPSPSSTHVRSDDIVPESPITSRVAPLYFILPRHRVFKHVPELSVPPCLRVRPVAFASRHDLPCVDPHSARA